MRRSGEPPRSSAATGAQRSPGSCLVFEPRDGAYQVLTQCRVAVDAVAVQHLVVLRLRAG